MSQTPLMPRTDTPIFDEMMSWFRGPSTGLTYAELNAPVDLTPPSMRAIAKVLPIEAPKDDAIISKPMWPNYNRQLQAASDRAQEAVSGIAVRDRRAISRTEAPHHLKTQAEKDAETAAAEKITEFGDPIPPMPVQAPRPKLSLVKAEQDHRPPTREERLGLPVIANVRPLFTKKADRDPKAPTPHTDIMAWADGIIAGGRTGDVVGIAAVAPETPLEAPVQPAAPAPARVSDMIFSGLHAAAERVRKLGMDPEDAKDFDARFGGKYTEAPVEYVGSDTVEMAMPVKE